jgi:hypothetical protein
MLNESGMGSPQTISAICDESTEVSKLITPSHILDLLQNIETNADFCESYEDALDQSIITTKDMNMITKLRQISETLTFNVGKVLQISCVSSESFKDAGFIMKSFFETSNANADKKETAVSTIETG